MRFAVTVATLRHIAVFILVACYAGKRSVFAAALRQCFEYLGVTGTAGAGRHILAERDLQRLMNLVAFQAVRQGQPFGMRFVTVKAGRFGAV